MPNLPIQLSFHGFHMLNNFAVSHAAAAASASAADIATTETYATPTSAVSEYSLPTLAELRAFVKTVARKERQTDAAAFPHALNSSTALTEIGILPSCSFLTASS